MATIYLDIPAYTPDNIIVYQAETLNGTQTEVVNDAYNNFPLSSDGNYVVVDSVDIDSAKYSFVVFTLGSETSSQLVITPAGDITETLQEIFDKVIVRLGMTPPAVDFIGTVQHVVDSIDKRLFVLQSDLIKQDYTHSLAADDYEARLPYGFLGIDGNPYISTATLTKKDLSPLPDDKRGSYTDTATPEHYALRRDTITVYPTCAEATTLKYTAYVRNKCDEITDDIPYGGIFNETIAELVVRFGANPTAVVDPILNAMVNQAVDRVVVRRAPRRVHFRQMSLGRIV